MAPSGAHSIHQTLPPYPAVRLRAAPPPASGTRTCRGFARGWACLRAAPGRTRNAAPLAAQNANNQNRGGNNQGPAPTYTLPKPPTPDQWWSTHGPERIGWVMAHFVVTSGFFEVADDVERRPCPLCQGVGIRTSTTQTGDTVAWICERCAGARDDITVKYR